MAGILERSGLRLTSQRKMILSVLKENAEEHLRAEDIKQLLQARGISVNLATVYRTLETFRRLGLLHKTYLSEAHAHYELRHPYESHFLCRRCGRVVEDSRLLCKEFVALIRKRLGRRFDAEDFGLEVHGVCPECRGVDAGGKWGKGEPPGCHTETPGEKGKRSKSGSAEKGQGEAENRES